MVANHVDSSPEKEKKKTFRGRFFQTGNKQQAAAAANIPQQQQGAYLYNPTNLALFPSLLLQETNPNIFPYLHISIPHISLNLQSLYSFDSPPSEPVQIIHQHSLILYRTSAIYRDCCFRSRERTIYNFRAFFKAIDHFFLRKDVSRSGKGETG